MAMPSSVSVMGFIVVAVVVASQSAAVTAVPVVWSGPWGSIRYVCS